MKEKSNERTIGSSEIIEVLRTKDATQALPKVLEIFNKSSIMVSSSNMTGLKAADALRLLSENLGKIAPFYAPFILLSHLLGRIAKRAEDPDDILHKYRASRLLRCVVEAVQAYTSEIEMSIKEYCSRFQANKIVVHAYGKLTARCIEGIASNSNPIVFTAGPRAREYASTLAKAKIVHPKNLLAIPQYFSYQLLKLSDLIIFQADTITPEAILARPGLAPLLLTYNSRIAGDKPLGLGLAISFSFLPVRAKGILTYQKLSSYTYKQPWHEEIQLPLFEIIPLRHVKRSLEFTDEHGPLKPRPIEFRRKTARTLNTLLELVDARCRLYEV